LCGGKRCLRSLHVCLGGGNVAAGRLCFCHPRLGSSKGCLCVVSADLHLYEITG
jgi:hypothetical protein